MPKKDGSMTVAEKRAAGTNKAAVNQAAKAANTFTGNVGKAPTTSPKPSPRPTPSPSSSPTQVAKERAQMSVKDRRAGQAESGMSMKDYKAGNTTPTPTSTQSNTFTTAAGYEMEKGAYSARTTEMYENYKANNPTAGTANMGTDGANFDKDGYLSYDSTKPQYQANEMLKKAGYKAGDMLWKPGAKDDLNGRELTGRISRITENGNYIPEYVNDAINSSHKSTGNPGYAGEVGLGADQAAYNRQYEQENDVHTGQANYQREANGLEPIEQSQYQQQEGQQEEPNEYQDAQQTNAYTAMPQMRLPSNSPAEMASQNSSTNVWNSSGMFKNNKGLNLNFSFNPGRFNQGQ